MKAFYLSLFIFIFVFTGTSYALDIPDDYTNEITALEFYPSGAKFTFRIPINNTDGSFTAYLPGAFNPESVRAVNPESVYGDIKAVRRSRTKWIPSQLEYLKDEAEEQSRTLNELTAKQASLEQTLNLLRTSTFNEARKPADLLTYIKDAQALRLETENELSKLKAEIIIEREKLSMMNNELKSRSPRADTSFITVTGRAKDTVIIEASTSYASWKPEYIMNLDSSTGKINVQMFVRASQQTGLDYEGNVTFHTKTPNENLTTPLLNPLKVGIKPKEEKIIGTSSVSITRNNRMYRSVREEEDTMVEDAYEVPVDVEEGAVTNGPAITESISDRTVRINGLITGDGIENEYAVIMNELNLTSTPVIVLVPEQRSNAWIIASMDEGNQHLIPGDAELRVDGHSSGKIYLEEYGTATATGQKSIPFGYAEQITVKKEALIEKTGTSWFSGVFTSGYKLEITNGTKEDKLITVRDRLPVPTDDQIKLNIKRIEPAQKEKDAENRLTWELNVPAGETTAIIVDYTLSYPSGEELLYK